MDGREKVERFTIDAILLYLCRMEAFTRCTRCRADGEACTKSIGHVCIALKLGIACG